MTTPNARAVFTGDVIGGLHGQVGAHALQHFGITRRERDVLQLMANGMADKEIAVSLSLSTFTVNKHVCAILRKIGAVSRTEAAVRALRMGLVV